MDITGSGDVAVPSAIQFEEDVHLIALFPHTHLRGKSWEYKIVYPDGHAETVLPVPHYDFNWQTYYIFATPLAVPKGSKLEAVAHFGNSANNPSNPDPTKTVHWGEQPVRLARRGKFRYFSTAMFKLQTAVMALSRRRHSGVHCIHTQS